MFTTHLPWPLPSPPWRRVSLADIRASALSESQIWYCSCVGFVALHLLCACVSQMSSRTHSWEIRVGRVNMVWEMKRDGLTPDSLQISRAPSLIRPTGKDVTQSWRRCREIVPEAGDISDGVAHDSNGNYLPMSENRRNYQSKRVVLTREDLILG
jgi:hypothetical protein